MPATRCVSVLPIDPAHSTLRWTCSPKFSRGYAPPATPDPTGPTRAGWTCVDDYNGYTETPPVTKAGNVITDAGGYTRSVSICWIDPVALVLTSSTNTGVKQITVTVSRGNIVLATVAGYRTSGWVNNIPAPTNATGEHPPTAVAAAAPTAGSGGHLNVNFSGSSSSDHDGNTLSYSWSFGDGTAATGVSGTHNYTAAGTYNATLTVYDGFGGEGRVQ